MVIAYLGSMDSEQISIPVREKGSIWFRDAAGQVFKGTLVEYDQSLGHFWVHSFQECGKVMDVVITLKDGVSFPTGKSEWCGQARLMQRMNDPHGNDGAYLFCLEMI